MPIISALAVSDPPELWRDLGFTVEGSSCRIGSTVHDLGAAGDGGVLSWSLDGVEVVGDEVEGLPTTVRPAAADAPPAHPNGVTIIDHVVVFTPNMDRTVQTLEKLGVECRRLREAGRGNVQAFFRFAETILEVVGPANGAGDGPARFFGLAFTVDDLDATASFFGDRLRPAKDAVQRGRRIATLDKSAGSTVAMAFMSR
jgi:catechol 2,3-dioxygenase-like lactoylglutathione lyase family enzyme